MTPRTLVLSLTACVALAPAAFPPVASSVETTPTIEAVYPHWSPEQEAIKPMQTIDFVNKNGGILHGIHWTGGPIEPTCTGVPINTSSASWSGSCEFEKEGTYTFECTVHPFMKGTVYVNATGTIPPPPPPPPPPSPGPPTASTEGATSATEEGATLKGTVNPDGQATSYLFEYGTDTTYGQHTTEVALAASDHTSHPVSATVTGLTPGTHYHFRLRATNASGPVDGADREFTTTSPSTPAPSSPPSSQPTPPASTAPSTTPTPSSPGTAATEPPPLVSPLAAGSLKLKLAQRGGSLRVSLVVVQGGAPARLEVDLLAKLAHSHKKTIVGRLVRGSVAAGKASFSVALNTRGKSALRRQRKLQVSVKVTLTPPIGGRAVSVTRVVLLRA